MRFCNFLNEQQLLKSLVEAPEAFKLNKSAFIQLPKLSDRQWVEKNFTDTTIAIVEVSKDLLVLDCDNIFSFNHINSALKSRGIETLTTKSPYGGHFYFKVDTPPHIPHIKPMLKRKKDLSYYTDSKQLDIEFYDGDYGNGHKIMFDGANNGYYKIVSSVTEPIKIPEDFLGSLKLLSESHNSSESSSLYTEFVGSKLFYPSKSKANYIKSCLTAGSIHPPEFFSHYNTITRQYSIEKALAERNNFLFSVSSWAGNSCFLEEHEWRAFIMLVNACILKDNPLPDKELHTTILAPGRFQKQYFSKTETLEHFETQKLTKLHQHDTIIGSRFYIAYNLDAPKPSERYLIIDLRVPNSYTIRYLSTKSQVVEYCKAHESLSLIYLDETLDSNGNVKYIFNEDAMPRLHFTRAYRPNMPLYEKSSDNRSFTLNLGYFIFNPLIEELLDPSDEDLISPESSSVEAITEKFYSTSFYKVLSQNLIPDKILRAKFLGDLGTYLIRKSFLYNALVIKDIQGNTGKDSVLTRYLSSIIFGHDGILDNPAEGDNILVSKSQYGARSISADTLIKSDFNGYLTSLLVVINEDGDNLNISKFNRAYHKLIKQQDLEIREMRKNHYKIYNRIFTLRYTNTPHEILDKSETNSRFYISLAQKEIDLSDEYQWKSVFPSFSEDPVGDQISLELKDIIKYLVRVAVNSPDYCGYSKLPPNAGLFDETETSSAEDIEDILRQASQINKESPQATNEVFESLVEYFVDDSGSFKFDNLNHILSDESHKMYNVALTLSTLYYEAYPNELAQNPMPHLNPLCMPKGAYLKPNVSQLRKLISDCLGISDTFVRYHRSRRNAILIHRLTRGGNHNTQLTYRGVSKTTTNCF